MPKFLYGYQNAFCPPMCRVLFDKFWLLASAEREERMPKFLYAYTKMHSATQYVGSKIIVYVQSLTQVF